MSCLALELSAHLKNVCLWVKQRFLHNAVHQKEVLTKPSSHCSVQHQKRGGEGSAEDLKQTEMRYSLTSQVQNCFTRKDLDTWNEENFAETSLL